MPERTSVLRKIAAIIVLIGTAALFVSYYVRHPEVGRQLQSTSPELIAGLLALFILFVGSLALVNEATLRVSGARLGRNETLLLTIYSSIINFFGPLQSGPAFRAVYLKKKHSINLRSYTAATLLYYLFYALFSGLFIVSGVLGVVILPLCIAIALIIFALRKSKSRFLAKFDNLALPAVGLLATATLIQVSLLAVIYFVELHSILPDVGLGQVITYTGAANFALFVSVTPGAIGFRESFLVLTEKLHHIPNDAIVVANTIDRSVYILLLIILAVGLFVSHAHRRFRNYEKQS